MMATLWTDTSCGVGECSAAGQMVCNSGTESRTHAQQALQPQIITVTVWTKAVAELLMMATL